MAGVELDHGGRPEVAANGRDTDDAVALGGGEAGDILIEHDRPLHVVDVEVEEVAGPEPTVRASGCDDEPFDVVVSEPCVDAVGYGPCSVTKIVGSAAAADTDAWPRVLTDAVPSMSMRTSLPRLSKRAERSGRLNILAVSRLDGRVK